jgi:hypothetical protein
MTTARTLPAPTDDTRRLAGTGNWAAGSAIGLGHPSAWVMVGGFCIVDLIGSARLGLSIGGWQTAGGLIILLLVVSAAYRRRSPGIAAMTETTALWVAFTPGACVLTYLAATFAWPLQDAVVSRLDHAIGFDWLAWRQVVLASPVLHGVLALAYASLLPQILLSVLFFAATGRTGRSIELITLAALTLLPTILISILCPVLGPFGRYGGAEAKFLRDLLALRAGGPWHFELPALQGIIQMPSYHVVLAVLFTYAFRRTGPVGWAVAGLNVLMLPAIPPIGGHYLSDMIVGGAIAVLCILGWRRWHPGTRMASAAV